MTYFQNISYAFCILLFPTTLITCQSVTENNTQTIIPRPQQIEWYSGEYALGKTFNIATTGKNLQKSAQFLSAYLSELGYFSTLNSAEKKVGTDLHIIIDSSLYTLPSEGYILEIFKESIEIKANSPKGLFYGIQSLRQLLITHQHTPLPCLKITDFPRFEWRGMHLDVSRHFMPVEFVKNYIDYLSFLKMNVFHWHLVDDQGWRIEIKKYPLLTSIGGWRDSTLVGHMTDKPKKYDGKPYGGFYTQEQIKDIVNYASERNITIVPEIEMPGHSQAAIAAYPQLGCTSEKIKVWTRWGISPYIYNVDEYTLKFMEEVLDEVIQLFPSEYIHIGGDEALKKQWKTTPSVQNRMHELSIADEEKLQGYFISRIQQYLHSKGRKIIGWDEILDGGGISEDAAVMSWRGTEGGVQAAKKGHKVVMTPIDYCYFDHYQSKNLNEPLAIGDYLPLDSVYAYEPVPKELNNTETEKIIGVQGNVWTEYISTPAEVEYMIFPRIFAMCEIQWSSGQGKNFDEFHYRVKGFKSYMDERKINYARHLFEE